MVHITTTYGPDPVISYNGYPVAVLLAFLVLAALYESWKLPLAVILIVPVTILSALVSVWLTGAPMTTSSCRWAWWCNGPSV